MKHLFVFVLFAAGAVALAQPPEDPPTAADAPADELATTEDEGAAADAEAAEPTDEKKDTEETEQGGEGEEAPGAEEADEEATGPEKPPWRAVLDDIFSSGAMGLLIEGGIFMWPILILGILATGVIIERCRSLMMLSTDFSALRRQVAELLQSDRAEEALRLCDTQQGPVPAVLGAGVRQFLVLRQLNYDPGRIEDSVVKAMEDYSVHVVAALERHLPILATVFRNEGKMDDEGGTLIRSAYHFYLPAVGADSMLNKEQAEAAAFTDPDPGIVYPEKFFKDS